MRFNSLILKLIFSTLVFAILLVSLSGCSNNKINVINVPEYPSKISFDDFNEERDRREDIDGDFFNDVIDFTYKSSSLVLSESDRTSNDLFSPISLYMALSMMAETADGDTRAQIVDALNMDNIETIRKETGKLFRRLYFHNEIGKLTLGNSLWLNKNIEFKSNTLETLVKNYYTYSHRLDFSNKGSSKEVSNWVSENTGGKLGNNEGDFKFNPDDVMALINTIYFYDEWVNRFNVDKTKEDIFYLQDGNIVKCDFMNMTSLSHGFVKCDGYTASRLSLKNHNGMVFILPDEGVSPYDIVSDEIILNEAINLKPSQKIKVGEVVFSIPKFKFSSKLKLNDMVKKLGIENVFSPSANFKPLSDTKPLFVSDISQQAFISIDEKGVEATAYTAILYAGAAPPDGRAEMILNRPFIFAITRGGITLFVGIINNPELD